MTESARVSPRIRQLVSGALFIAGLAFCVVSLIRTQAEHPVVLSVTAPAAIAFLAFAIAALGARAGAWRRYVRAFIGTEPGLADAAYQSWLMLVAKYVPIMIAGFVARVASYAAHAPAHRVVLATLTELMGAVGAATLIGLGCLAIFRFPLGTPAIVAAALVGAWLVPRVLIQLLDLVARWRHLGPVRSVFAIGLENQRELRAAFAMQLLQWLALGGFVATSAHVVAPALAAPVLLAICGAYALAVVLGIAIVFLPGGIGAREAAFVWLASAFVDTPEALRLAMALRVAMSLLDLIAGAGCLLLRLSPALRKRGGA
jgi:uncharacterized membrane protein YbhN (UPF0104 family)